MPERRILALPETLQCTDWSPSVLSQKVKAHLQPSRDWGEVLGEPQHQGLSPGYPSLGLLPHLCSPSSILNGCVTLWESPVASVSPLSSERSWLVSNLS